MRSHESEDNVGAMAESLDSGEAASWGPTGPDGGPMPGLVNPVRTTARPWTPENVPCLRDCEFYFTADLHFEHGNYDGALAGNEPIQVRHICKAIPGVFLELSADSPVYKCSDWRPREAGDLKKLQRRRDKYYDQHPPADGAPPPGGVVDVGDKADNNQGDDNNG